MRLISVVDTVIDSIKDILIWVFLLGWIPSNLLWWYTAWNLSITLNPLQLSLLVLGYIIWGLINIVWAIFAVFFILVMTFGD